MGSLTPQPLPQSGTSDRVTETSENPRRRLLRQINFGRPLLEPSSVFGRKDLVGPSVHKDLK